MAKLSDRTAPPKPKTAVIRLGEAKSSELLTIGGSRSDRFNNALIDAMTTTGWFPAGQSEEDRNRQIFVAVTGLQAFKPADEIEGMIAAQAMAAHHASMECSRRAMLAEQPFEAAQALRKAAANASRTFVELLSALDRKRGKGGQQKVSGRARARSSGRPGHRRQREGRRRGGGDEARAALGDRPGAVRHDPGGPHRQTTGTGGEGGGMTENPRKNPTRACPTGA